MLSLVYTGWRKKLRLLKTVQMNGSTDLNQNHISCANHAKVCTQGMCSVRMIRDTET
jgi:hypothetical protein